MAVELDTKIEGVLWDMDGTLIDSEPTAVKALLRAAEVAEITLPGSVETDVVGMAADNIYRWFCRDFGLELAQEDWEVLKHKFYFEEADCLMPFEDAIVAWQQLDRGGVPQAIVSNSARAIVEFNCKHIGIDRPRLTTISRDEVTSGKPDPEGYLLAARILGLNPSRCVVLEDSLSGLEAGRAAGMRTFCVPHSLVADTNAFDRVSDLLDLIAPIIR